MLQNPLQTKYDSLDTQQYPFKRRSPKNAIQSNFKHIFFLAKKRIAFVATAYCTLPLFLRTKKMWSMTDHKHHTAYGINKNLPKREYFKRRPPLPTQKTSSISGIFFSKKKNFFEGEGERRKKIGYPYFRRGDNSTFYSQKRRRRFDIFLLKGDSFPDSFKYKIDSRNERRREKRRGNPMWVRRNILLPHSGNSSGERNASFKIGFFPKKKEAALGFPDFYFYSGKFPEDDLFRPIFGEWEEEEEPTAYYNLKRRPLRPFVRPLGGLK